VAYLDGKAWRLMDPGTTRYHDGRSGANRLFCFYRSIFWVSLSIRSFAALSSTSL